MTTTMTAAMLARAAGQVAEGKARAAAVRATLPADVLAAVEARVAAFPELLTRVFISPDNGKGRQTFVVATAAEVAEFVAAGR